MSGMADGSLTFVIPVRDARGVQDWDQAMALLQVTVDSCLQQAGEVRPRVVLAASRDSRLPVFPGHVDVAVVDLPWVPLPQSERERHAAIRRDKGQRVAAALALSQPRGHVMVVDWDDLVSPHLAAHVARASDAPGWYAEQGYIFDDGPVAVHVRRDMHRYCGSTIIHRWDLLRTPVAGEALDFDWVDHVYGSHRFAVARYANAGSPLSPLPFPAVAYRVRTGQNVSGSTHPARVLGRNPLKVVPALRPRSVVAPFFSAL